MINICVILKQAPSFERFELEYEDKDINWSFISELKELQEEISISDYDLIILDKRIWWYDDCIDLLKLKPNVARLYFEGKFDVIFEQMNKEIIKIEEIEAEDRRRQRENEKIYENTLKDKKLVGIKQLEEKVVVVEKIQEKIVEKIVYKIKDQRRNIFSVITNDNFCARDYYSLNLGAYLSSFTKGKSCVIDITQNQNLINYLSIESMSKCSFDKTYNAGNVRKTFDVVAVDSELMILRIEPDKATKSLIKHLIFTLRDYENVIFVMEHNNTNIPNNYILALVNKVHLLIEPTYPSVKLALKTIETLKECGQIDENIILALLDRVSDTEAWQQLFVNEYKIYEFEKDEIIENINKKELMKDKRSYNNFCNICGFKKSKNILGVLQRREKNAK